MRYISKNIFLKTVFCPTPGCRKYSLREKELTMQSSQRYGEIVGIREDFIKLGLKQKMLDKMSFPTGMLLATSVVVFGAAA